MSQSDGLQRLQEAGIIAVIRADRTDQALRVAGALLEGGIRAIEMTFTTPGAAEALREARSVYGDRMFLGAGTMRERAHVELAVRSGAEFLVTPHLRLDLLDAMLATELPAFPGVFTASEVAQALDRGARAVKLFPASTGGPKHLRSLRGPFPELQAMPTGGIGLEELSAWFEAGALAIGAGSELCPRHLMEAGRWEEITGRARRFVEAAQEARAAPSPAGGRTS